MKRLVRLLALLTACLVPALQSASAASDFAGGSRTTSTYKLVVRDNNGRELKTFTAKGTDRSLSGTGFTGSVIDNGDHWTVVVTGGMLYGSLSTDTGLEIRLSGIQTGIVCTRSVNAVRGYAGVLIRGPGMLHIDQHATYAAIYGGLGNVAVTGGAVVGVNGLGVTSTAVSGTGVRVLASALHVNSAGGRGIACDKGGLSIGESIVTVCSSKAALYAEKTNSAISVTASCVHLVSGNASALQCGDDISSGMKTISVANSVFCALGAGHGIQGTLFSGGSTLVFDNVVGVIAGKDCGIYAAKEIFVDGGSTKLSIAGNIAGDHTPGDTTAVDYLSGNNSSGQGIRPSSPSRGYFGVEAGNVKLFSPGVCALDCGTNAVTGGKLEIPGKATYGDFQTLFTWQGAISAAEIFMGRSLFESDLIYSDFDIAQAFSGVLAPSAALFSLSNAKPRTGVCADMFYVTGGEVSVEASVNGIHLGGCYASHGAYLTQKGGRISVEAGRIAIADDDAVDGYVSTQAKESGIWVTGGKLTARGGWDGILTCGYVLQEGGTIEAAATGGYTVGTISTKPGLRGYALSANNGFAIDGGSFVATAGTVRTTPNTSSAHSYAKVYPCDLAVSGTGPVSVSGMVPSWYGVNDLYPVGGKLRFWLPAGTASLKYGGAQYTANGTGKVVAGTNVFRTGSVAAALTLAASSRSFTAAAASGELGVTANVSWTAKSSASWLTVKTASGSGNGKIAYNVAANTGASSRSGTITVSGGGLTRTFTVTQSGTGSSGGSGTTTLTLGASSRSFTAASESGKELAVTANVSWTVKSSVSWLTVKTASGKGNGKIVYNVAANTGTSSRTGKITVTGGGLTRTFTVTQSGKDTRLLLLGAHSRTFSAAAANNKELAVTAGQSWSAESLVPWLVLKTKSGKGNGKIVYNVAANPSTSSRVCGITVRGGGLTRYFMVTQNGRATAALTLNASSRSFTASAASSKELGVTASVPWTAKSSASWLAVKTVSGKGNGKIVYNVAANTGAGARTGRITVTGGGLTRTFTVTQSGKTVTLTLGAGSRTFTASAANSKELAVTANVAWKVLSSASWLKIKTASGKGNGKIVYNVAAYKGTGSRTGLIMVSGGGKTVSCSIVQLGGTPNLHFYQPSGWPAAMFVTTHESNTTTRTSFTASTTPLVCIRWAWDNNGNTVAPMHKVRFDVTGPSTWSTTMTMNALDTTHYRSRHMYYGLINSSNIIYAAPSKAGVYTATVTLDPDNEMPETNESDNKRSVTFTVVDQSPLDLGVAKSSHSKNASTSKQGDWVVVTTSDQTDGGVLLDGDEGTIWGPVGEGGGWVVLSYSEAIDVKGVTVKGEGLPEDGVRVLLSEDADDWREECEGRAQYVWVVVPEGAAGARLTEILVEEE